MIKCDIVGEAAFWRIDSGAVRGGLVDFDRYRDLFGADLPLGAAAEAEYCGEDEQGRGEAGQPQVMLGSLSERHDGRENDGQHGKHSQFHSARQQTLHIVSLER